MNEPISNSVPGVQYLEHPLAISNLEISKQEDKSNVLWLQYYIGDILAQVAAAARGNP